MMPNGTSGSEMAMFGSHHKNGEGTAVTNLGWGVRKKVCIDESLVASIGSCHSWMSQHQKLLSL